MELIALSFLILFLFAGYLLVIFRKARNESQSILSLEEVQEIKGAIENILEELDMRSGELLKRIDDAELKLQEFENKNKQFEEVKSHSVAKKAPEPLIEETIIEQSVVAEETAREITREIVLEEVPEDNAWIISSPEQPADINQLIEEGMSVKEIAQKVGRNTGEIELILGLNRFKQG